MAAFSSAIMLEQWSPNKSSLYNVKQNKRLALWEQTTNLDANDFLTLPHPLDSQPGRLVEPDGIEPTTSCLQSRRSPS
ncbi:protein of unknown function [Aminobacter niigataensis]|nr:protein of unknown function [Aminobacter niigataensis]CAI2933097.1 protein of unknown function [Aminobacter niigataensis]